MTTIETPVRRYEDNAEQRTVTGWICLTCRRYYGDDERLARWCCATELPCGDCGGRNANKSYTCCAGCRQKREDAKWAARPRVEWDGQTPLYSESFDRWIFDEDDLQILLEDEDGRTVDDCRLIICEPIYASEVDDDYWHDELPDEQYLDDVNGDISDALAALNAVIRAQKAEHRPLSWLPGKAAAIIARAAAQEGS